jgi:hypothetical protein
VVLLKRRFGRQTSSRWRFSQKNDWTVQVIPQQAIKAIPVLSTRKIVTRRQELGVGMALFTTAFGLYGGVLWSGELQGSIIHGAAPTVRAGWGGGMCWWWGWAGGWSEERGAEELRGLLGGAASSASSESSGVRSWPLAGEKRERDQGHIANTGGSHRRRVIPPSVAARRGRPRPSTAHASPGSWQLASRCTAVWHLPPPPLPLLLSPFEGCAR